MSACQYLFFFRTDKLLSWVNPLMCHYVCKSMMHGSLTHIQIFFFLPGKLDCATELNIKSHSNHDTEM